MCRDNDEGKDLTILDINPAIGKEALSVLKSKFPNASVSFLQCDVSSWEEQASAFGRVYSEQGKVDIVIANAGITEKGGLFPSPTSETEDSNGGVKDYGPTKPDLRTVEVNFLGVLYSQSNPPLFPPLRLFPHWISCIPMTDLGVQLALHYISKNERKSNKEKGSIICTASNAGLYAFPMAPIYSATKHGVIGLVRSLARSIWEKERIRINALAPAVIGITSLLIPVLLYWLVLDSALGR